MYTISINIYTLQKLTTDICAIRLDYVQFVTRGPDVDTSPYTVCSHDTVKCHKYFTNNSINSIQQSRSKPFHCFIFR